MRSCDLRKPSAGIGRAAGHAGKYETERELHLFLLLLLETLFASMFLLFFLPTGDHGGGWFFRQITKGMEKVAHRHCSEFNESYDYDKWNATIE